MKRILTLLFLLPLFAIGQCDTVTSLTATSVGHASATISWTAPSASLYFVLIYNGTRQNVNDPGGPYPAMVTAPISGLTPETVYTYTVVRYCSGSDSAESSDYYFTTTAPPCDTVTNVAASVTSNSVSITSTAAAYGDSYVIYYVRDGQTDTTTEAGADEDFQLANLRPNTVYWYQIGTICGSDTTRNTRRSFTTSNSPAYTPSYNFGWQYKRLAPDSTLNLPTMATPSLKNGKNDKAALIYDTVYGAAAVFDPLTQEWDYLSTQDSSIVTVSTVANLSAYSGNATTVIVTDSLHGGVFNYYISGLTADNGVVFSATGKGSGFWRRQFNDYDGINVCWFGARSVRDYYEATSGGITTKYQVSSADTTTVFNSTSSIQAALNYCLTNNTKKVFVPSGIYFIDSIGIPDFITFEGAGMGDFGRRRNNDVTQLIQFPGVNNDMITFITNSALGSERVTSMTLQNFMLRGNNGNTIGNGINFRKYGADKEVLTNNATLNGTHVIQNLMIREFPEHGIYCRRGGVPGHLRKINLFFNGGYGIYWEGASLNRNVTLQDIDGDANKGGAVVYIAGNSYSNFYLKDIRGEYKDNVYYGSTPGYTSAQPHVVQIGPMGNFSVVNIDNVYGNSSAPGFESSDAAIYISATSESTIPFISFNGVSVQNYNAASIGNRSTIYDSVSNVRIPDTIPSGVYYRRTDKNFAITGFNATQVIGLDGVPPAATFSGGNLWLKGASPLLGIYETDAAANKRGTIFTHQSSAFQERTLLDDGTDSIYRTISINSSGIANFQEFFVQGANRFTGGSAGLLDIKHANAGTDLKTWRFKAFNQNLSVKTVLDDNTEGDSFLDFESLAGVPDGMKFRSRIILTNSNGTDTIPELPLSGFNATIRDGSIYKITGDSMRVDQMFNGSTEGHFVTLIIMGKGTRITNKLNSGQTNSFNLDGDVNLITTDSTILTLIRFNNRWKELSRGMIGLLSYVATDNGYTVTSSEALIKLPTITTGRAITLPSASICNGKRVVFYNANSSGFSWTISGVVDGAGNSVTAVPNQSIMTVISDGTTWVTNDIDIVATVPLSVARSGRSYTISVDTTSSAGVATQTDLGSYATTAAVTAAVAARYTLQYTLQSGNWSPADATTYYFGLNTARSGSTIAARNKVPFPFAGTIKKAYVYFDNSGGAGTSETFAVVLRIDNTTDNTLIASATMDAAYTEFSNTGLSIAVTTSNYAEVKITAPTWVTNPTNVRATIVLYIE